ncbi:MAG: pyridoxal 5'-phosphate synthase glutaminase subunit PdxT [Anaerolineales bacterium]|nr:MAG: pyridoxal 5'-phosphate synthase glutaminase subunit PdxT [Anaerolineales bacterium]
MTSKKTARPLTANHYKVGVLALQGSFLEHQLMLSKMGVEVVEVRLPEQLVDLEGLIIPGGESTTIGKLAVDFGLLEPLRAFGKEKAIWGTCAGAILLSKDAHRTQPLLGLMDITVDRNAFGRQIASFETELDFPALESISQDTGPFHGVFIRAPLITSVEGDAKALSTLPDGRIVAARQNHLLATAFHPELTDDDRIHRYFIQMVGEKINR